MHWLLLLIYHLNFRSTLAASSYSWWTQVTNANNANVSIIAPWTKYNIRIKIVDNNNLPCAQCAKEFVNVGGCPVFSLDEYNSITFEWIFPWNTTESGIFKYTIRTNQVSTHRFFKNALLDKTGTLNVNWYGAFKDNIGIWTSLGSKQGVAIDDLKVYKSIPGESTTKFLSLSHTNSSLKNSLIASTDDFESLLALELLIPDSLNADIDRCGTNIATGFVNIHNMVSLKRSFLIHTSSGVIVVANDSLSLNWSKKMDACIQSIHVKSQTTDEYSSSILFIVGGGSDQNRVWKYSEDTLEVKELLDSQNKTLQGLFGSNVSLKILDISASSLSHDLVKLLVQNNGVYFLVTFNSISVSLDSITEKLSWENTFRFPTTVPQVTDTVGEFGFIRVWNSSTDSGSFLGLNSSSYTFTNLSLTGLAYHKSISSSLFVLGNAVFLSPNDGQIMSFVRQFSSLVQSFDGTLNGDYLIQLADNQLWYGHIAVDRLSPVFRSSNIASSSNSLVSQIYQYNNADVATNYTIIADWSSADKLDTESVEITVAEIVRNADSLFGFDCPYERISFEYFIDPFIIYEGQNSLTEVFSPESSRRYLDLPSKIFLDLNGSFSFSIIISIFEDIQDISSFQLSYTLSNTTFVSVTSTKRIEEDSHSIIYDFTIIDNGMALEKQLGESFSITSLLLAPFESSFECLNKQNAIHVKPLLIYSGCAPDQTLLYHHDFSDQGCPNPDSEYPCIYYEEVFNPGFLIQDKDHHNSTYPGYYTLLVVGMGISPSEIVELTDSEVFKFNPSIYGSDKALIWTGSLNGYTFPVFSSHNTSITWKCEQSSPCGNIIPKLSNPSPFIYLMLEASTEKLNSHSSYCKLKERFIIRLYGLPVKFNYSVMMTFGSMGFCILSLVVLVLVRRQSYSRQETLVSFSKSDLVKKSVTQLSKSKTLKSAMYSSASSVLDEAKSTLEKLDNESNNSSEEEDFFAEKPELAVDSVLTNLIENNRLRNRGRSVMGKMSET